MNMSKSLPFFLLCLSSAIFALYSNMPIKAQVQPKSTETPAGKIVKDFRDFEMVYIPAGTFSMGVTRENFIELCFKNLEANDRAYCANLADDIGAETGIFEVHDVKIGGFWADRYEVTIEQYQICINSPFMGCRDIDISSFPQLTDDPNKPRVGVNWYDAVLFCNTRGARLPSEAEWEYMAKGTQSTAFAWGNSLLPEYRQNVNSPHPVGSIPKNVSWSGVYDLSGNISQWVEDRFQLYATPQVGLNKSFADDTLRVIRGASWIIKGPHFLNVYRSGLSPASQNTDVGFRCVKTSTPK